MYVLINQRQEHLCNHDPGQEREHCQPPRSCLDAVLITQLSLLGINHHPDFYGNPFLAFLFLPPMYASVNHLIDFCLSLNLGYKVSIRLYMDSLYQYYGLRFKTIVACGCCLFIFTAEYIHTHCPYMPHLWVHSSNVDICTVSSCRLLQTVLLWWLYLYLRAHITMKRGSVSWFRAQPGWSHTDWLCH